MRDEATPTFDFSARDLSACEREPLHNLGAIQPYGYLVAFALPAWTVAHVSENLCPALGLELEEVVGARIEAIFPPRVIHDLRNALQASMISGFAERLAGVAAGSEANALPGVYDAVVHSAGQVAIVELVPASGADTPRLDPTSLVKTIVDRLRRAPTLTAFLSLAARQIRAITGFDRVMIYRFLEDQSGQVVAEALRPGLPPFLHLRYPASDIPSQARALFARQRLRMIPNVAYAPVPIWPKLMADQRPVDLSLSALRDVSRFHIQYLKNMGSAATLTVSIMEGERLWGLVACHHETPRRISATTGASVELLAEVLSAQVEAKTQRDENAAAAASRAAQDSLIAALQPGRTLFENLSAAEDLLRAAIPCDGFGVLVAGRLDGQGAVPPAQGVEGLLNLLRGVPEGEVFASHALSRALPEAASYGADVSGLLALPLSATSRDYLLLFRREVLQTVRWGGDPRKPVVTDAAGQAIGPRTSFAAWQEMVSQTSEPWRASEIAAAERLRVALLDVLLRRAESLDLAQRSARESQLLLVAELNHRVKNVLAVVRSLVGRSVEGATSLEAFRADLQQRISALSLAHDQLTLSHWTGAPLHTLIESEAQAWLAGNEERLTLSGPPVMIAARAYQTLALVLHEMMTNAAKHGALSVPRGRLITEWRVGLEGDLALTWTERGGPAVSPPRRRGFGSVVIEQSVPFELQGQALVDYRPEGLVARFIIPAEFVREEAALPLVRETVGTPRLDLRGKNLLLVEDSMMIALDAQAMLQGCGADVELAATSSDARRAIRLNTFDAAILDVDLYTETSFGVADDLRARSVPFVFATGYGENVAVPERFKGIRVISKPYVVDAVRAALAA